MERRAIVTIAGEQHVMWRPVGLFPGCCLEEAIEKGAFECQIPSVLRATFIDEPNERDAIAKAFEQGQLPLL